LLTLGIADSPGVPASIAALTLNLPYNDPQALEDAFTKYPDSIAGVIVEPVAGNMGCIPPTREFLDTLRSTTQAYGSVLIFDEVMTGFRVGPAGAQGVYGIEPDLTTLGKIIGGGLPVGAFGGRADIMSKIAPAGPVYQAGTLSGNPLAVSAGLATLAQLDADAYVRLNAKTQNLADGLRRAAHKHNIKLVVNAVCGMFGAFFTGVAQVRQFADVETLDLDRFKQYFHGMLTRGIYLAPSAYETGFMSLAHSDADIATTLAAVDAEFANLASQSA
jgi:glutamate-1-semialdehyde 2,1-aminomutase